jgi:putative heme-binding domain-containing protein
MTPSLRSAFVCCVLVAGGLRADVPKPEKWADPKLPVTAGLELWLDASRASGDKATHPDGKLDAWFDASGKGRHLRQSAADARPVRLPGGTSAVVRFDGIDDHLRAVKQGAELESFTLFVVTAPRLNPGGFRGVLAFNRADGRDYETGLNVDFGPNPSAKFNTLNVEGRGFGGYRNLMKADPAFGELLTLELSGTAKAVALAVDGKPAGDRPRDGKAVSVDEITVGARHFTNGPGPQKVDCHGRWDVAEVLLFNRELTADEAKQVRAYLDAKHAALKQQMPPDASGAGLPLVPVKDPPPVQVLLPGFTVRELPLDLTNINNVLYRPDGTLVALAYNGVTYHLTDTNGDGLEDKASVFWDSKGALSSPIGMALTPPKYPHGDGVFVCAKGKVLLVTDTDGDGQADKETAVAEGWKEFSVNIDVIGVAVDQDGSVYFGRGTPNYANGYLLDKEGKAGYSLKDERGTIQKVSPDFKTREVIATGIRFPVGMKFNRHGDLFCTDQEGATWMPNGNPLDELLHIQKGRHYGFPARHPKHLPDVLDEPSTFDYGPQHQSTCGFCFNEPVVKGGATFGPKSWAGDALVTGESRGKLYRTQVVKSKAGYVARNHLFACLNMLTIDCCIAPDGGLIVACHSGGPDWGSGPTGKGKLFKITYTDDQPQPVLAWPAGPREVRVEFDRPVEPALLKDVAKQAKLTAGRYVRAADRFESLWPGYAVVVNERAAPRFDIPVRSAQLTPDRRTLVLATDTLPAAVHYALTLPAPGRPDKPAKGTLRQVPEIDLDFDLTGVEATWTKGGKAAWSGWLPHADLEVAKAFTAGSAPHDELWKLMSEKGELTLKTKLDLSNMLRPAVQPGSNLGYEFPAETVKIEYGTSANKVKITGAGELSNMVEGHGALRWSAVTFKKGLSEPIAVEIHLSDHKDWLDGYHFYPSFTTAESKTARPLAARRFLLPWANTDPKALGRDAVAVRPKELDGGSWAKGRAVFFSEQGACSKCHAVHGKGGDLGPDLSNLIHRDYASVLRDITQPSFAINPDHLTQVVHLDDGRTFTGVVRTEGDKLRVGDKDGKIVEVSRKAVERITASPVSTMPEELPKLLGPERMKDLMTFLLTDPVRMPDYGPGKPPEARTRKELAAVLAGAPALPEKLAPMSVVLVGGKKDHGPGEHDYPAWQKAWKELLATADATTVTTADDWPTAEQFKTADVLVFYQQGQWTAERAKDMDAFLKRGGGAVYVHYAVDGGADAPGFAQRIGLAWQGGQSKFRHGPLELGFDTGAGHPVSRNFSKVHFHDESYWNLIGDPKGVTVLARGKEDGADQPLFWTLEPGGGRVFVSIPGHFAWTFDDPLFRVLLLRGIAWSAKQPVDRFNALATPGARLKD